MDRLRRRRSDMWIAMVAAELLARRSLNLRSGSPSWQLTSKVDCCYIRSARCGQEQQACCVYVVLVCSVRRLAWAHMCSAAGASVSLSALRSYPAPFAERLAELYCESRGTKRSADAWPKVSIETNVASLRAAPPGDPWNDATVPAQEVASCKCVQ